MHNLALIPARGGSQRIPRKNIKNFLGRPIMTYSIETALQSRLFEEVMVSTDDQEIAELAIKYGATVPFYRSAESSGDRATTISVIQEVVAQYKNHYNKEFDLICCIYPTAPFIKVQHLKEGLNILLSRNFDSVFPVVAFGCPIWRGLEITDDGKSQMIWPEYKHERTQDFNKVYHDAGQWYWLNMKQIKDSIFNHNSGSIVLSEAEVQDIDTLNDWSLAEMKFKLLNET